MIVNDQLTMSNSWFQIHTGIIQKQYIGCYGDNAINQSMDVKNPSGQTGRTTSNTNSIEFCLQICSTNNYTFAGMQVSV